MKTTDKSDKRKKNVKKLDFKKFRLFGKSGYSTVISIDTERSVFHFYSLVGNDKSTIEHHIKSYSGGVLDEEFFKKFKDAVKEFTENTPSDGVRKIAVVLPDNAVLTDAVKVPTMRGGAQTKKALDITLGGLYRNYTDLRILSDIAQQNKLYSTFTVAAVQKRIVSSIYAACSENKLLVDTLTYASCASVGALVQMNPKLKNSSYLFLDIKDVYSRFVFVANGRTVGCYTLPFGFEFLGKDTVIQEDMLFDHSFAELAVLNAREKAKSKKLTVMAMDNEYADADIDTDDETDEPFEDGDRADADLDVDDGTADGSSDALVAQDVVRVQTNQKIFTRKAPRKLPKFMQREVPETKEGIAYENFRVFVKWVLSLIQSNDKLTEIARPERVLVNMPSELAHVIEYANIESEENGISFSMINGSKDPNVSANLELFGALYPRLINSMGKF